MPAWHEEEAFWTSFRPTMFPERVLAAAVAEVDRLLALAGTAPGAAVLDLPCGPGRHSLELARRGFRVTGVDRTVAYLEEARTRARGENLDAEWIEADMRAFCRPEAFDLALNLYTGFGYFEDPAEDLAVARNLHQSLKPGGKLVMDLMGKEVLARVFRERDWREESDGALMLEERRVCASWSWMENRWIRIKDGVRSERRISHRIYSAAELTALLHEAGFASTQAFGDLAGAPYDHTARRLVILASTPEQISTAAR